jgi:hypothetical protein
VDPQPRGPDWMPITPKTGSLFHADSQLERFKEFVAQAPSLFARSGLDKKAPNNSETQTALNADERALLAMTSLSEKEFLVSKALGPLPTMVG